MSRLVAPRQWVRTALPPLLLAALFTAIAYLATGTTTGFFFAGVVVATLLTPPLVLTESVAVKQLLCAASVVTGVACAWLVAVADGSITLWDMARAVVVVASYAFALGALSALLSRLRLREPAASALAITFALAWLTWPVWFSPHLAGHERLVGVLSTPHPLLALDGVFRATGPPWSERYFMYNFLTVLNQDVAYELPRGVLPAVLLHAIVGAMALLPGRRRRAVRLEVDVPDRRGTGAGEKGIRENLLP